LSNIHYLIFVLITTHSFAQKIFRQPDAKGTWQYVYPFKDKSYVLAIQHLIVDKEPPNANIYFGKSGKTADKIFWKENLDMRHISGNITYEDYSNDRIKDLLIFEDTGG
jgi:hypothetical protein